MNITEKNSKEVPLFCEYFCLVPQLDHARLMAGDYVKSVLHGRGKCELGPPHYHYLTLRVPFCNLSFFFFFLWLGFLGGYFKKTVLNFLLLCQLPAV